MGKKKSKEKDHEDGVRVLARNRKAFFDYQIHQKIEAGMVLVGSEVKSLRDAQVSLAEGYAEVRNGEAWLHAVLIKEYPWANQYNHEPRRVRKLLLHRSEIHKLGVKTQQRGFTLIPLSIYLKNGKIKIELGLATGKREFEKREAKKTSDAKREMDRVHKG